MPITNDMFPPDIKEAADKIGSDWIKAVEFEGDGLILQVSAPLEKVKANNPKYGAKDTEWVVKNDLLEVGETFRYSFIDGSGTKRRFDSKSAPFFLGFKQCDELGVGDWVHIKRTGKTDETRYFVVKTEKPVVSPAKKIEYPEPDQNDIPF